MSGEQERQELKEYLRQFKPSDRAFLRKYVRASIHFRASLRQSVRATGNDAWARLLNDIEADDSDRQTVAEVLDELEATSPTGLREVRILSERDGQLGRLCKLVFTNHDFSLYLVPYAPHGRYFFGSDSMKENQVEKTFDFTEQLTSEETPHLSIHELGQVHIKDSQVRAGPLHIPRLQSLTGQHIATISADAFDGLGPFQGTPKKRGPEFDFVIPVGTGVESGRLAIYANGKEPTFAFNSRRPTPPTITLTRRGHKLYFAVVPISQEVLGDEARRGVTVLAGWDPHTKSDQPWHYLYVRGV